MAIDRIEGPGLATVDLTDGLSEAIPDGLRCKDEVGNEAVPGDVDFELADRDDVLGESVQKKEKVETDVVRKVVVLPKPKVAGFASTASPGRPAHGKKQMFNIGGVLEVVPPVCAKTDFQFAKGVLHRKRAEIFDTLTCSQFGTPWAQLVFRTHMCS